ncbi:MAG: amidohydrolase [Oscillospiraceae bacterium]|jgi:amidohydrolase|nr:amidohydrolase [Oscillospiraceae bacterium]
MLESVKLADIDITKICHKYADKIIAWRREFHQHPELSHHEEWTSWRIQVELDRLGIPYDCIDGSKSFVGRIIGEQPGEAIALRADIDALPIQEETGAPYASQFSGKMHACGHDAHAAILLGAASALVELKAHLHGTVYLCFQAAEEVNGGAEEIVEYLELRGGVKRVAGLHIMSNIPEGSILIRDGATMFGLLLFKADVAGRGGHASRPDQSCDPIKAACDLVLKLSSIPAYFCDPHQAAVVHIGQIQAGTRDNIFPDHAFIGGGARFFSQSVGEEILERILSVAKGVGDAWGVKVDVQASSILPPVYNDPSIAKRAREHALRTPGLTLCDPSQSVTGSDNVSLLLAKYPGVYAMLGGGNVERGITWAHHNTKFDIDECALPKGAEWLARVALDA